MTDKVEIDLEDLDDLKDLIGDQRKGASLASRKYLPILCSIGSGMCFRLSSA